MTNYLLLLYLATTVQSLSLNHLWHSFKVSHRKSYANLSEEGFRRNVFAENLHKIEEHNKLYRKGLVSFSLAMNHFGDLTDHEFHQMMSRFTPPSPSNMSNLHETVSDEELPEEIDWTIKGAVTRVKSQGHCGSCWSFSATGALEGQNYLKTGILLYFSEQNLIDCSFGYGNKGCDGGLMDKAYRYIIDNKGLNTEEAYPYEGKVNNCRFRPDMVGAKVKDFVNLPYGEEIALQYAVAKVGPIAVVIDYRYETFRFYSSGKYYDPECSNTSIVHTHALLAVGYGSDSRDGEYWLLKNSWGTSWGDGGYMKLARNSNNHCGVANWASYPIVE